MNDASGQHSITGIIPFSYFGGMNKVVGSTHLRVDGIVNNASDFCIWRHGHRYDSLIFQKVYWKEMMARFTGPKILDLCDPDWVNGNVNIKEIGSLVDAITCSSGNLTELIANYFPGKLICHIPDRLDFKLFPIATEPRNESVRRVVWFGFIHNAHETLEVFAKPIKQYSLELTIISDKPYSKNDQILGLRPKYIRYEQQTSLLAIQSNDVVLNPRSDKGLYKYKSNNKSIIGWKLGLPVAENPDELVRWLEFSERRKEVEEKKKLVVEEYNILSSVAQYRSLLKTIVTGRPTIIL
jgi:hypothetical protein